MTMMTLRMRNNGRLAAVNLGAIATVTAEVAEPTTFAESKEVESPVFLSVRMIGEALEMQGASISILKLDDEMTELWDAPVQTAALRWGR